MNIRITVNSPVGTFTSKWMDVTDEEYEMIMDQLTQPLKYFTMNLADGSSMIFQTDCIQASAITVETENDVAHRPHSEVVDM